MSAQSSCPPHEDVDVLELVADPVIAFDAERRIVQWNRAAEETYGYGRGEALGRNVADLLRIRFPVPVSELRDTLAHTGVWRGDIVAMTSDGRELSVESVVVAERDREQKVTRGVAVHRDITARLQRQHARVRDELEAEREELHNRLHRSQRLESIGQVAGVVAHDFNNLLSIIINYAALITGELGAMERAPTPACWGALREDIGEIQTAAERAARLTHQLLAFSTQEAGAPQPVDLNASVRGVEDLVRSTIGANVDLRMSLAEDLCEINIDPGQPERVLLSLVVNSLAAMPNGGVLTVDTATVEIDDAYVAQRPEFTPGPHVRLRVSDTGTGMAADVLEHAFDPFFTTKTAGEGSGLGLAAVRGVVRRAGGDARLYSQPGIGTTFTALFPVAGLDFGSAVSVREAAALASSGQTVLLVEEEAAAREITRRILVSAGYRVIEAGGGGEALEAAGAADGEIDLLLSDLVMGGILVSQLAGLMREQRPSLPVLYMTEFVGPVLGHAFAIEGAALVEKPFTAAHLLDRVAAQVAAA